jgi:phosphoglycerate dehydrogenase-like enzyme
VRRLVLDLRDVRPLWTVPGEVVRAVRDALPAGWEVVDVQAPADGRGDGGGPSPDALAAVRGAEVYIGYGVPRQLFLAANSAGPTLRWAHSGSAGIGSSLFPELVRSDLVLTNSAGIHAPPMAETVIAMILHFARGLDFAVRAQARRHWFKEPFESADTPVREIGGRTLGIVGFGGIGREVGVRASALGMRVVASRRRPIPGPPWAEVFSGGDALDRVLERSDYLVVSVPSTGATRGLIGREELERLPAGAVVVNVARGSVLDTDALIRLLRAGRLRGAALDVFEREPLPPDSPLWSMPNVLVTPHVSGTTDGYWRREGRLILENLRRYLAGEDLLNRVDKEAGY